MISNALEIWGVDAPKKMNPPTVIHVTRGPIPLKSPGQRCAKAAKATRRWSIQVCKTEIVQDANGYSLYTITIKSSFTMLYIKQKKLHGSTTWRLETNPRLSWPLQSGPWTPSSAKMVLSAWTVPPYFLTALEDQALSPSQSWQGEEWTNPRHLHINSYKHHVEKIVKQYSLNNGEPSFRANICHHLSSTTHHLNSQLHLH